MKVISVRNVHEALPEGLRLLKETGIKRNSRNGLVLVAPEPVTTVFQAPWERVLFWSERDANPFLHLYESLWMLAGRNDVEPLKRYTEQYAKYSDDGVTVHDAYGHRWRQWFGIDQLEVIAQQLKMSPDDRRSVLQMWDVTRDLGRPGKAFPCNLIVTFQRDTLGRLDMTVFNRSNDIVWGLYGANAVHFSMLQEYMALKVGCPIGVYTHISTNFHMYERHFDLELPAHNGIYRKLPNPYDVYKSTLIHGDMDKMIDLILSLEPTFVPGKERRTGIDLPNLPEWVRVFIKMLRAHHLWRSKAAPERYKEAMDVLLTEDPNNDWIAAGLQWLARRSQAWEAKMENSGG